MNTSSLPLKAIEALVDSFQGDHSLALSFYRGRTLAGRTTYSELHQRVLSLSLFLVENLGIARGDRILILSQNRLEVPTLLLAIFYVGAVAVPLNPSSAPDDWEFIAGHSGARGIFATKDLRTKFLERGVSLEFALDIEALLGRCMNDSGFAIATLEKFRDRALGDVDLLRSDFALGNIEGVTRIAHNLKSAAAHTAAAPLRKIAFEIEQAGAKCDIQFIETQLALLKEQAGQCAAFVPKAIQQITDTKRSVKEL